MARIEKKTLSWLPHFSVIVDGVEIAGIDKEFSFFKPKYRIDAQGLRVEGDWVDLNFTVVRGDELVAEISQRWLSWGDSYEVIVHDDAMATIVVALVIAIDKVKADDEEAAAAPRPSATRCDRNPRDGHEDKEQEEAGPGSRNDGRRTAHICDVPRSSS